MLAATATSCFACTHAFAQAGAAPVSPVTVAPPTLAPDEKSSGYAIEIPQVGALQPPAGSENLSVDLGTVEVEGAFPELSQKVANITATIANRRVTLSEVYAAASQIEAEHARAGYVLARVSVPAQQIVNGGTLRLVVVDGFLEDIDVSALPERVRAPTAERVEALKGKTRVKLGDIEEALSLAADLPGLTLRSTLMRGTQPAAAKLVLEGDQRTVTGFVSVDNQLDPSLGRWGVNLQLVFNSALGLGEQIYGFGASDYDISQIFSRNPRERVIGGGAIIPLMSGRVSLNPEVTFARTTPDAAAGVLRTRGTLRRLSLRAQAIVHKARRSDLRAGLTVEQVDVRNDALDFQTRLNHDRYMVARLGGTYSVTSASGSRVNANVQLSKGLGGLGSISAREALLSRVPYSRVGAATNFLKLSGTARANLPLSEQFSLSLSGSAQTSFGDPVFRSEQFSLEGYDGLSAYLGGETAVDAGIVGRSELSFNGSAAADKAAVFAPYGFLAFGTGKRVTPTVLERRTISALNYGAGVRARFFERLDLRVEYARSASHVATLDEVDRVGVSLALQF